VGVDGRDAQRSRLAQRCPGDEAERKFDVEDQAEIAAQFTVGRK
jgi:hypothetical protein